MKLASVKIRKEVSSATLSSRHRMECDWIVFQNKSRSRKDEYQAIQQQVVVLHVIFQASCVLLTPLWKCLSHQRVPALATFSPRLPKWPTRDVRNIIVIKGRLVFSNTSVTNFALSHLIWRCFTFILLNFVFFPFHLLPPSHPPQEGRSKAVPCSNQTSPTYKLGSIDNADVSYSTELTNK